MSKLLTLAFARVGHSDARLHGLRIPCFDKEMHDKPVDTIVSLHNGGGKSSIIQSAPRFRSKYATRSISTRFAKKTRGSGWNFLPSAVFCRTSSSCWRR
ncbi:MAG: hypothetical protein GY862_09150 [Gammaproteobacteria bacterium]|nr:hypothetical protein [Gammaproteobacteria bacterium]